MLEGMSNENLPLSRCGGKARCNNLHTTVLSVGVETCQHAGITQEVSSCENLLYYCHTTAVIESGAVGKRPKACSRVSGTYARE
jgi:hypothetical protein